MNRDTLDVKQEDYDLVDRLAAAYMRQDSRHDMAEIAAEHRRDGQREGIRKAQRDIEDEKRQQEEWSRGADTVFETLDGLSIPVRIEMGIKGVGLPGVWKRPCKKRSMSLDFANEKEPSIYEPIKVRTYEFAHERDRQGRPIYVELP